MDPDYADLDPDLNLSGIVNEINFLVHISSDRKFSPGLVSSQFFCVGS